MRSTLAMRSALLSSARVARFGAAPCRTARFYSVKAQLAELDASKLQVTKTTSPKALTNPKDLVFGKEFTGMPLQRLAV